MVEQAAIQPSDGGSNPTPSLHFIEISKRKATELIIEHHYLHRKCPISWCWGIEDSEGNILGVLTIGKPCSWSAACGVVGEKYTDFKNRAARSHDVFELNRLWVSETLPKNSESKFIAWCLKKAKKINPHIILISYADGKKGHVGYVYQATNWIYAGVSVSFQDINFPGYSDYRSVPIEKRGLKVKNRRAWASNPDVVRTTRSPKHRYVWFSDVQDRPLLAWKTAPYPKKAAA